MPIFLCRIISALFECELLHLHACPKLLISLVLVGQFESENHLVVIDKLLIDHGFGAHDALIESVSLDMFDVRIILFGLVSTVVHNRTHIVFI